MTRLKKALFWTVLSIYGTLLFLLLTFYRLPADKMLGKAITFWTETQALFSAETMSFSLPLSYAFQRLTCQVHWLQGASKDRMDSLNLGLEWSRIFSGSFPLKSEAILGHGQVEARLGVPFLGRGYLDARGYSITLEELSFLEVLLGRGISGQCDGELRLLGDVRIPLGLSGRGSLSITEGSLESKLPLAGLRTIPFHSLSAYAVIEKGMLFLKDGKIEGPAVSGTFSGDVKLDERLGRSLLNITANLTPGPMLNENDLARQLVASLAVEGETVTVRIKGTLGSPSIKWEKD